MRLKNALTYVSGAIVLVDAAGTIIDWCYRIGGSVIVGTNVTIPSDGATYYLIITSNNGDADLRMWDSTP